MTNDTTVIGALTGKVSMVDTIEEFCDPLKMIMLIHQRGAKKYPLYGWYNDPEHTDSTIKNNLNAMCRHFSAYSMGFPIDPEGLPHIFHLCCRAGMLITTAYRAWSNHHGELKDPTAAFNQFTEKPYQDIALPWYLITSEELVSLTKSRHTTYNDADLVAWFDLAYACSDTPLAKLTPLLADALFGAQLHLHQISLEGAQQNLFTTVTYLDRLFELVMCFGKAYLKQPLTLDLSDPNKFDDSERAYIPQMFPRIKCNTRKTAKKLHGIG